MNSLEDELRRMLADPSRAAPGWPDAPERIRAGMRRRRRRRAMVTGAAAVVVLIAVAAAASTTWRRGHGTVVPMRTPPNIGPSNDPDIIPWFALPPAEPTQDPSVGVDRRYITCKTADLALHKIMTSGAGGTLHHLVMVRNTGSTRCDLSGSP